MTENQTIETIEYILQRIKELSEALEAFTVEINKDIGHLYAKNDDIDARIYGLTSRVEDLEGEN